MVERHRGRFLGGLRWPARRAALMASATAGGARVSPALRRGRSDGRSGTGVLGDCRVRRHRHDHLVAGPAVTHAGARGDTSRGSACDRSPSARRCPAPTRLVERGELHRLGESEQLFRIEGRHGEGRQRRFATPTSQSSVTSRFDRRAWSAYVVSDLAPLRLLDLAGARQQRFEVAVLLDQLRRGLDADAGHARHVVGGVADQRLDVDHLVRRDAEIFDHARLRRSAARAGSRACPWSRIRSRRSRPWGRRAASGPCRTR